MSCTAPEMRSLRNGATTVTYAVTGPTHSQARTICLIASTGRGPEDFFHLATHLAAGGLRVVMPRPRGMGGSEGPLDSIDFHDLAGDAAAVLRAEMGPGGAIVTGHAYGCWIARTVAQDFPEMIDGLILLAAGAGKWPEELSQAINTAMTPDAPEAERLAALKMAFFTEDHDPRPWLQGWSGDVVRAQRAARGRTDRDSWWPSGTAPMLDIVGLQDPFRSEADRDFYLREFGPRLTLKLVNGASHALPDEKPAEVATLMLDWIGAL
ncbi:pimeloyl-ACP methyl ester carboxylesterase [Primorskyibacter sedentarius]|uniref:Pimeloyl-ACP methyl ester carboxylesterase n=1 Tax=Primorskyibacter sedentarius TaxID=745311 RepID=A0A4R3JFI9_9RHOB|nr:alpha/beta hydrolase [Primorskyibacter sedentarius]TCS64597.1 pimeloyl-ACP methyl ester carboxylesterase [Primorskyibacter sedentarius]